MDEVILAGFIGLIVGALVGTGITITIASDAMDREKNKAIAADVARWQIDPKTGVKQFVYGVSP